MRYALAIVALAAAPLVAAPVQKGKATHRAAPARAKAPVNWIATVVRTPEGGARMGNPNAPVKLIEYGSRTCPHCAHFDAEGVPALQKSYVASGQVSYEFRDYPVHGALDLGPILLGHCVPAARFFPVLAAMMENQQTLVGRPGQIPAADQQKLTGAPPTAVARYLADFYGYSAFMLKRGLPPVRARACLGDAKAIEAIAARTDEAGRLYQVNSTPTFVINGAKVDSVNDWAGLEPALRAAGAK